MDRAIVTGMVEDYWRAQIPAMQNGGLAAANEIGTRFEERINQTAKLMAPLEGAAFLQMMDAERERIMNEYVLNPIALKQRLGIAMGVDAPRTSRQGSGLGRLAVRTAVRATIWESIWMLFRR